MSARTQTLEWLNARIDELEAELKLTRRILFSLCRCDHDSGYLVCPLRAPPTVREAKIADAITELEAMCKSS